MKQDSIEYILVMDKFKNYKPYTKIEKNIQKLQEQIQTEKNEEYLLEQMIRRAYRNKVGFYFRGCEKIMRRVIEDEKIRNVKNHN